MKQYWNEVQPVDSFSVKMNGMLHPLDLKVISLLYQPLIGPTATSLYLTLYHQVEDYHFWSEEWNHYQLMDLLGHNLEEIFHSRLKLEGIGLLKTYTNKESDSRTFIYELQAPLSAEQFFTDGMLNIYLYQKLGQSLFTKLRQTFSENQINEQNYNNITRSFQDVFSSFKMKTIAQGEGHEASVPEEGYEIIDRADSHPITIDGSDFDFETLFMLLSEIMVPRKAFTAAVKDAISKLAYLYSIDVTSMKNIILGSLSSDYKIDIEELRKAARDWYQMENEDQLPQLVDRIQPIHEREHSVQPTTMEEKLIHYLETVSPRQLLIDLSEGAAPAKSELHAVEDIMFQQKLTPGVTNVLIHYVMLRTDMKLSKNYMEKIASHWARKKVRTVKSAMDLAKSEHRQYQEWASGNKRKSQKKIKPIRTEKLPDWFFTKEDQTELKVTSPSPDIEEKRRRAEAIQRKYQKVGGEKGGAN